jgi:Domain of unknown function (DUF4349)
MTRKAKLMIAVPLTVVAVVVLFAVVGLVSRGGVSTGSSSGSSGVAMSTDRVAAEGAPVPEPALGSDTVTSGKSQSGGAGDAQGFSAAVPPASAPSAHYLLRTGDMALLVGRGTLLSTVDRIKSMTMAMNGYVMSSAIGSQASDGPVEPTPMDTAVSSDGGGVKGSVSAALADPYASLVVRVPEQYFETAIKRFSRLGVVQSASTSSEDVTSQYVDLRARLHHYRAVERRLIGFLSETTDVNQMLAVQSRIDDVQLTIEELTAQLKSMRETTTYGTLSVYVSEKDRTAAVIHAGNTFGGTFWHSIELLGHGARVTALVLTALLPFIVVFGAIGLLVWYVVRRLRRIRRRAAQPSLPA